MIAAVCYDEHYFLIGGSMALANRNVAMSPRYRNNARVEGNGLQH